MSKKERTDIRIVRLVIAMFKCPLRYYFNDPMNCELALRYCGAPGTVKDDFRAMRSVDYDDAISLFQVLYDSNSPFFADVFEYMLNDFVKERANSVMGSSEIRESLKEIENELLSLGYKYDLQRRKLVPVVGIEGLASPIESELDLMLGKVNGNLVSMRHGAWEAFMSKAPDAPRQCMSSARELLRQCIDKLSPGNKTRKGRISGLLKSKSESELVGALADVVEKLYASLSKEEHTEPSREAVLFTLRTVENTLYFLLRRVLSSRGKTFP